MWKKVRNTVDIVGRLRSNIEETVEKECDDIEFRLRCLEEGLFSDDEGDEVESFKHTIIKPEVDEPEQYWDEPFQAHEEMPDYEYKDEIFSLLGENVEEEHDICWNEVMNYLVRNPNSAMVVDENYRSILHLIMYRDSRYCEIMKHYHKASQYRVLDFIIDTLETYYLTHEISPIPLQRDVYGLTPLHTACRFFSVHKNIHILRLLIKFMPQALQTKDANGLLPFHHLLFGVPDRRNPDSRNNFEKDDAIKAVEVILKEYPQALQEHTRAGENALNCAISGKDKHIAAWLLKSEKATFLPKNIAEIDSETDSVFYSTALKLYEIFCGKSNEIPKTLMSALKLYQCIEICLNDKKDDIEELNKGFDVKKSQLELLRWCIEANFKNFSRTIFDDVYEANGLAYSFGRLSRGDPCDVLTKSVAKSRLAPSMSGLYVIQILLQKENEDNLSIGTEAATIIDISRRACTLKSTKGKRRRVTLLFDGSQNAKDFLSVLRPDFADGVTQRDYLPMPVTKDYYPGFELVKGSFLELQPAVKPSDHYTKMYGFESSQMRSELVCAYILEIMSSALQESFESYILSVCAKSKSIDNSTSLQIHTIPRRRAVSMFQDVRTEHLHKYPPKMSYILDVMRFALVTATDGNLLACYHAIKSHCTVVQIDNNFDPQSSIANGYRIVKITILYKPEIPMCVGKKQANFSQFSQHIRVAADDILRSLTPEDAGNGSLQDHSRACTEAATILLSEKHAKQKVAIYGEIILQYKPFCIGRILEATANAILCDCSKDKKKKCILALEDSASFISTRRILMHTCNASVAKSHAKKDSVKLRKLK